MFSGFANVNLPKDANMIPEHAQVMVMMPASQASAEATLAKLKNIVIGIFVIFVLCVVVFLYFNLQKEKNKYVGQVLPGVVPDRPIELPSAMPDVPVKQLLMQPDPAAQLKFVDVPTVPAEVPTEDIVHIVGEIPTWADDEISDEIDKKVSETDEAIISKLKSREAFIKDLGENVAAMAKTAPIEKI